jgi:hypothetical protein
MPSNDAYRGGWDRLWGKPPPPLVDPLTDLALAHIRKEQADHDAFIAAITEKP